MLEMSLCLRDRDWAQQCTSSWHFAIVLRKRPSWEKHSARRWHFLYFGKILATFFTFTITHEIHKGLCKECFVPVNATWQIKRSLHSQCGWQQLLNRKGKIHTNIVVRIEHKHSIHMEVPFIYLPWNNFKWRLARTSYQLTTWDLWWPIPNQDLMPHL